MNGLNRSNQLVWLPFFYKFFTLECLNDQTMQMTEWLNHTPPQNSVGTAHIIQTLRFLMLWQLV